MRLDEEDFGKLEFLAKFQTMRNQTFKKSTIKSAFKNTGLIPYNSEVVLQKVRALPRSTDNYPTSIRPYQRNDFILHHHHPSSPAQNQKSGSYAD